MPPSRRSLLRPPQAAEKFLVPGETRHLVVRRHAVVLVRPLAEVVAACVVVSWLVSVSPVPLVDDLSGLALLAAVARGVYLAVAWDRERISVTNRRLLRTSGVFTTRADVMPIAKVTDLSFVQSTLGLLLGYGDLVLESAGQDQALRRLGPLPRPRDVYEDVTQVVHSGRLPTTSTGSGAVSPDSSSSRSAGASGAGWRDADVFRGKGGDDLLLPDWVNDR